ncbi:MAG: hypothetical protein ACLVMF_06920 [Christensenellales bacterium]
MRKNAPYCNTQRRNSWGQRVIRFYDLDGHLMEAGKI